MHRKITYLHMYRVWYYSRFQASTGGLGMYPPQAKGGMAVPRET